MSQEGYIQTKVRDLTEEVQKLEQTIQSKKQELERLSKEIEQKSQEAYDKLKPLIEQKEFLSNLKSEIEISLGKKFNKELSIHQKKLSKQIIDGIAIVRKKYIIDEFNIIQDKIRGEISALVDTLNLKLNLGIVYGELPQNYTVKDIKKAMKRVEKASKSNSSPSGRIIAINRENSEKEFSPNYPSENFG